MKTNQDLKTTVGFLFVLKIACVNEALLRQTWSLGSAAILCEHHRCSQLHDLDHSS